jgi:hypothetical protein
MLVGEKLCVLAGVIPVYEVYEKVGKSHKEELKPYIEEGLKWVQNTINSTSIILQAFLAEGRHNTFARKSHKEQRTYLFQSQIDVF